LLLSMLLIVLGASGCDDETNGDGDLSDVGDVGLDNDPDPDAEPDGGPDFPDQEIIDPDVADGSDTPPDTVVLTDGGDLPDLSTDTLVLDRLDPTEGPSSGENIIEARG